MGREWYEFMYNEKNFKLTIIFTKIRRYVFIFCFVILSLVGAYVLSEVLTEILEMPRKIANIIMIVTGVCVFVMGFILTSNLNFKIQQAYLEMKTLKKLNLVSYKLDKLLEQSGISVSDEIGKDLEVVHTNLLAQKIKKLKKEN